MGKIRPEIQPRSKVEVRGGLREKKERQKAQRLRKKLFIRRKK
jgi:hypothetical protein